MTTPTAYRELLELTADNVARDTVEFTITHGLAPTAVLDPGDGAAPITVPLTGGTGTHTYIYTDPGHHTYTATATAAVPQLAATLNDLAALSATLDELSSTARTLAEWPQTSQTASVTVTVDVGRAGLWATVIPADPLPYIQVDAFIGAPETVAAWRLWRITDSGNQLIQIGDSITASGSWEDHEAPLNTDIVYRLEVDYTDGSHYTTDSAPVSITGTRGCFLTDIMTGRTVATEVQAWPSRVFEARQSVLGIINRPDPVVLSDQHLEPSGTWTLLTRSDADTAALLSVLRGSRMVLLRTQPTSSVASVYAAVGTISENRYTGAGWDARRLTTVQVQEMSPVPATARTLGTTLQDLADARPTLAELAELRPNLLALSRMRLPGGAL